MESSYNFTVRHIAVSLCLATSIFSYTKIFVTLHHNQNQAQNHAPQGQPSQATPLNVARYRKAVSSALWVKVTFVVCYLPHGMAVALTPQRGLAFSVKPYFAIYGYFSFVKLVIKPVALLLEDQRSKASSKEHNQTT